MSAIRSYAILASAVAGRRLSVHVSDAVQEAFAYTEGHTLWLPAARADHTNAWQDVVAQASLVAAGSLAPEMLRRLLRYRQITRRRYLVLEIVRASRGFAARLPLAYSTLPDILETARRCPATTSATASLAVASSSAALPESPEFFGAIRPYRALRWGSVAGAEGSPSEKSTPIRLASRPTDEIAGDTDAEESKILQLLTHPFASASFLSTWLARLLGGGAKAHSDSAGSGGAELPVGRVEMARRRGPGAVAAPLDLSDGAADVEPAPGQYSYPEWDADQNRYRANWVWADSVQPWREEGARDVSILARDFPSAALRRQLAPLGLSYCMHGRQLDGSDLDVGPLIKTAIDLRAGHAPANLRVYRAGRRTRRDLAVAIALDISGSTGEHSAPGSSQFEDQMKAAYQLGRAFDALGDTVTMFAFHSWGRKGVRWLPLKNHDERWSATVASRFAQLEPMGYTRMGAAIRHAARELRTVMRLPHRLIILVTDGFPYDQGYETTYAEGDVRKAIADARAEGTACISLCIGRSADAQGLRRLFDEAHLIMVDEPAAMVPLIRATCRSAFARAFRQRLRRSPPRRARYGASPGHQRGPA